MNNFSFSIPSKVSFGASAINKIDAYMPENTKRVLIVSEDLIDNKISVKRIEDLLGSNGIQAIVFDEIGPGANSLKIEDIVNLARKGKVECIIGLGGTKVLSIAKLSSLLVYSRQTIHDLIDGNTITAPKIKFIAVPTTPGCPFLLNSKSYIIDARNRNPVILDIADSQAYSAVIDPELAHSLSKKYTIAVLMRIILSSIEGLFSTKSAFLSDNFFYRAIKASLESLSKISKENSDPFSSAARSGLLNAMGHTLSEQGIGSSVSYALNSEYSLPKSLLSSIILPYILEDGTKLSPVKMYELGKVLGVKSSTGDDIEPEDTVDHIRREIASFEIPLRLGTLNIKKENIEKIAEKILSLQTSKSFAVSYNKDDVSELIHKLL